MLQQTQVKTALPYFARWLRELPDFAALAAAPAEQVAKLWEGLGYYSRSRNLHRLAQELVALPEPPTSPAAWQELPGIGPYTAAAITSISFHAPAACVDGNVVRILARLTADGTAYRDSASAAKAFTPLANALLPAADPGTHNQAMMELGATVCFRRNPRCTDCPVFSFCTAGREGDPAAYPRLAAKVMEQKSVARLWCVHRGRLLLHRTASGARRLAGLHELPTPEQAGVSAAQAARLPVLATKRRGITRYQITETIHAYAPTAAGLKRLAADSSLHWVALKSLDGIAFSGPHRRWITELTERPAHK